MASESEPATSSKALVWIGWILTVLPVLMLCASAIMKLARPQALIEEFARLGWPESVAVPLGIVEIACALVYLFPRTAVLGAILVTGYLGGATATHVRIDDGFIPPIVIGMVVWGGLYLRDARVRALLPWRK